jgi:hypothetical protein
MSGVRLEERVKRRPGEERARSRPSFFFSGRPGLLD